MAAELGDILPVLNQIAIIFAIGFLLKLLSKKTNMPFIVLLILAGTGLATLSLVDTKTLGIIPDVLRMLALVIVVFANGFYLRIENIVKYGKLVLALATLGVVLTAGIIASVVHASLGLALLPALFLGSLLCGTDPAAIESIMERYPQRIQEILNIESIMNQPLTVILPLIIFDFAVYKPVILIAGPIYFAKLVVLAGIGFVVGIAGFFAGRRILKIAGKDLEEIAGLATALAVYVITENLGGSGIIAVGITSILLNSSKTPQKQTFAEFNRELALIFTIFVFVLLGAEFPLQMLNILEITHIDFITVIVFILLARLITVLVISYKSDLQLRERLMLGLTSPKGMGPAALAPLALVMAARSEFMSVQSAYMVLKIVYLTIIISILLAIFTSGIFAKLEKRASIKLESVEIPGQAGTQKAQPL